MKKVIAIVLILAVTAALAACAGQTQDAAAGETSQVPSLEGRTVGICFPDQSSQRWQEEGTSLTGQLEARGFRVILEYARNDVQLQTEQVEKLIAQPVDCMVIAAIDSLALTEVLQQAKSAGIPVIAYDRLLMHTDAVFAQVGFDSEAAGSAIGDYIVQAKQLPSAEAEQRSYTIEFFMGAPEDSNAIQLHRGIMGVLRPYLDSGVLVCRSGRTAFEDTCIQQWAQDAALDDCRRYLEKFYADTTPDICCAASDSIAEGCRAALEEAGFTAGEAWPLITGQDAELDAVRRIVSGHQAMTVYKDTAMSVRACAEMVTAALTGIPPETGGITRSNGVMEVPASLCLPVTVDETNYRQILVAGGRYTEEQLTPEDPSDPAV